MRKIVDNIHATVYNHINNINDDIIKYCSSNKTSDTIDEYFKSILLNDNNLLDNLNLENINIVNQTN
jgi:hypothetical protein